MTFKPIYFKIILLVFLIHLIFVPTFGSQNLIENPFQNFNAGKGDYFGEEPPGLLPKVFSPSLVDPKIHHLHSAPAFSGNGDEMFISIYINYEFPQKIFYAKQIDNVWIKPEVAFFSGDYQDGGPLCLLITRDSIFIQNDLM